MLVPFCPTTGQMLSWSSFKPGVNNLFVEWREIEEFHAILKYKDYSRGRSSVTFFWEDVMTGVVWPLFLSSMEKLLSKGSFQEERGAIVDGKWKPIKKGANYGLVPVFDD